MINLDQFFTQSQIAFALLVIAAALAYLAFGRKLPNKKKKRGNVLIVALTIIALLGLGIAGYFLINRNKDCGGFMGTSCPLGFSCQITSGDYGKCVSWQPSIAQAIIKRLTASTKLPAARLEVVITCEPEKEYQTTHLPNCQCPNGYQKTITGMTWSACPKEGMRDCPTSIYKCIKK